MRKTWLLALSVVALATTAHAGGLKGWHTDLKKAKKEAQKTGKPIMIDFDGSDW
ncbi:MAG: hypothetical protein ACYTGN_05920 [Planctomycetota bacterium]|jgi:hypothetical protein